MGLAASRPCWNVRPLETAESSVRLGQQLDLRWAQWAFLAAPAKRVIEAWERPASRCLCAGPSHGERLTVLRLCACAGRVRRCASRSVPGLHLWKDFLSPEEGEQLRRYLDEGQPPWKKEQFGVPTLYKAGHWHESSLQSVLMLFESF